MTGRRLHLQDHYTEIARSLPPGAGVLDAARALNARRPARVRRSHKHREARRNALRAVLRALESRNRVAQSGAAGGRTNDTEEST